MFLCCCFFKVKIKEPSPCLGTSPIALIWTYIQLNICRNKLNLVELYELNICCITLLIFLLTDIGCAVIPEEDEEYDDIGEAVVPPQQTRIDPIDDDIYEELPGNFEVLGVCIIVPKRQEELAKNEPICFSR